MLAKAAATRTEMPRAQLWYFFVGEDNKIYVNRGGAELKYGALLKVRVATEKENCIKVNLAT